MGLLDLPSPLLTRADAWLGGWLPPLLRLLLWAVLAALLSMELYRILSPQRRIARIKQEVAEARRDVAEFDGPFDEAGPRIRRMLSLSMRHVLIVLPSTLVASLPLLAFIVWLDSHYGTSFPPPGAPVPVEVPGDFQGRWLSNGESGGSAEIVGPQGEPVAVLPVPEPVTVIHKRRWWNALIGNPAGYVPEDLPFDRVEISLPRQQFLPAGPDWLRGWEPLFFVSLILFALAFKTARGIK